MPTTLTITLQDNGQIDVTGPIQNKLLSWGLLYAAGRVVEEYNPAERPLIEIPTAQVPSDLRLVDDGR